jgi:glycosyltransferase involved in cell wall biosynthesis
MRALVVTNMYPPHAYGGYEQSCQDVVERWRDRGHRVEVLTSTIRVEGVADVEEPGVRRELELYWADHEIRRPGPWRSLGIERRNLAALERALEELRPDVVSVWAMGALSFGLLSRLAERHTPCVLVVCDEWPVYGPVVDGWLRRLRFRPRLARLVRLATGVPSSAPPIDSLGPACFVSEHLMGVSRERSPWQFPFGVVVPSGIDPVDFPPTRRELDEWRWRLLYAGRIDPRKGIATVVRGLAACPPEAVLEVHGSGDDAYLAVLRALASELGVADRVRFTVTPRSGLAAAYGAADAVVFPSEWEEPFGLVPLEAMACGTPVVGTIVGGAREFLVDEHNCLVFPAGDHDALVTSLRRLAADAGLRRRLADGGLSTVEYYTVDRLAERLEDYHLSALAPGACESVASTPPGGDHDRG